MKKRIFLSLCILTFLIFPVINTKANDISDSKTCEDTISEIVSAINQQDWNAYLSYLEESKMVWMRDHYFANPEENSLGINQVVGAELKDCWLLDYQDFWWLISYNEFDLYEKVGDQNIFGYLLAVDYDVTIESKYFYQGLNFNLWIFAFDGEDYKLVEFTIPPFNLIEKYITEKTDRTALDEETQKALAAAESRANGTPVNLEGMVLWDNITPENHESSDTEKDSRTASENIVPSQIRIFWRTKEGGDNQVYYNPFRTYCQQVLAHKWFASWNDMSLNAGAHCVKTFSWYYCCYPHASDGSYDVNSAQQSWTPTDILRYYYDDSDLFSGKIQFKEVTEY